MVYYRNLKPKSITELLRQYGIQINCLNFDSEIPYSFWGTPEAGRMGDQLFIRDDTPIHSILHESCHYICMPSQQRRLQQIDAAGSAMEESATCYLQILLADHIEDYDRDQLMLDMDAWGYSFRLGSARNWFSQDAAEARNWLIENGLITQQSKVTWKLRT